MTKQMKS